MIAIKSKDIIASNCQVYQRKMFTLAKELQVGKIEKKTYHYSSLMQLLWLAMPGVELSTW
jgi:hypothetical protein